MATAGDRIVGGSWWRWQEYSSISVADFDQDGRLDLLLTGSDSAGNLYRQIWRNLGNIQFTNLNLALPGIYYGMTAVGDYNNDGRPDFVTAGDVAFGGFVPSTQLLQVHLLFITYVYGRFLK